MDGIEKYVVSLELARKLKDAGFPQETEFYWIETTQGWRVIRNPPEFIKEKMVPDIIAAPLASEIGERLPWVITVDNFQWVLVLMKRADGTWGILYERSTDGTSLGGSWFIDNDANAKAKMWLWLKENSYLNLEGKGE